MKILIITLAILIAAAGAGYSYHNRELFIQAALYSEAFDLSADVKTQVEKYYEEQHVLPHDNEQAGLAPAHTIYGTSVKRVSVARDGVVLVQFNEELYDSLMVFTPRINILEGNLRWTCSSDSVRKSVLEKLRPECIYTPATTESKLMQAIAAQDITLVREKLDSIIDLEVQINGNTPIMLAAKIGNVDIVSMLLEAGAKVDHLTINAERRTALMVAISNEKADIASLLLSHGASVVRKDYSGRSAMDYARQTDERNGDERFQLMLSAQLNPKFAGRLDFREELSGAQQREKLRALHARLKSGIKRCQGARLLSILAKNGEIVDEDLFTKSTSHPACVKDLSDAVQKTVVWKSTLHAVIDVAIDQCDSVATDTMLAGNSDFNIFDAKDVESFVFRAVRGGCIDILKMLLRRHDINGQLKSELIVQAIKQVSQHALLRTVTALIESGADINATDSAGMTPLSAAIAFEQPVVAKILINAGADVAALSSKGSYPVIDAAKKGYHHLVLNLIESGADVNAQDGLGRTALHVAVAQGRQRTVKTLLRAGANKRLKDANGIDPVVMAGSKQFQAIQTTLLEH